jgi:cobyrinic acid a,c-diamide synthase
MNRFLISATHKSSGKTTLSIGLCAALEHMGKTVQPFKKGPDYIDPMWLGQASGRPCYNLDFYTMSNNEIVDLVANKSTGADICLIEGNKGLFDGLDIDGSNSNAALAGLTRTPVILVLDTRGMTRGVAPLVLGYQAFDPEIQIRGVIFNNVGGSRHESKLRSILDHYTDVPVIGAVHKDIALDIDERHLGLMPCNEAEQVSRKILSLRNAIESQVDLTQLLDLTGDTPDLPRTIQTPDITPTVEKDIRIGIIQDEAFGFYYPSDLETFAESGASLVAIDSLKDSQLPDDIDGLFIGGGFPEERMAQLSENQPLRSSISTAIEDGLPAYAECGGLMYLCRNLVWKDVRSEMVGVIPADAVMYEKPQGRGYVRLTERDNHLWPKMGDEPTEVTAHEFHYSRLENIDGPLDFAYNMNRGMGIDGKHDGIMYQNLLANYTHLRDTERYHWIRRFVAFVRQKANNVTPTTDTKVRL